MQSIMRVVVGGLALFNFAIGLGFLFAPARLAAQFALSPVGAQGLATLRADFPGFFVGAAVFAMIAAWYAEARWLLVPLVMLGLALTGRCVSLIADGVGPMAAPPMLVEAVMLAILVLAYRSFTGARR